MREHLRIQVHSIPSMVPLIEGVVKPRRPRTTPTKVGADQQSGVPVTPKLVRVLESWQAKSGVTKCITLALFKAVKQ